jgi:hypothetical protein
MKFAGSLEESTVNRELIANEKTAGTYVAEATYPKELLPGRPSCWLAVWMLSDSRTAQLRWELTLMADERTMRRERMKRR